MRSLLLVPALAAGLSLAAAPAEALTVPFTENFTSDVASWRDGNSNPLTWVEDGGPDGSSHASGGYNYLGFSNPFGGGPVTFRGQAGFGSSGGAFGGDWLSAGVNELTAWVRHEAGVPLTFFLRLATAGNFPGATWDSPTLVESGEWTLVRFDLDPSAPCEPEFPGPPGSGSCAAALANVGNVQIGTSAPESLTSQDRVVPLAIDQITIVPEPGSLVLATFGLAGLGVLRRRA